MTGFGSSAYGAELWGYQEKADVEKCKLHQVDTRTGHQNTRIYCPGGNEENKSKGRVGHYLNKILFE